jgi:hypothetical protein
MSEKGFDAGRYLVKLRGKEYLEVKWRLLWLRTEHPDAVVETEMVSHILPGPPGPMAIFKARVSLPGGGSATGWGQEEAADFGDYLEKAETKALGRALAALGFGTQFTEDFEFADGDEQRVVDSPVDRGAVRGARMNSTSSNGASNGGARIAEPAVSSANGRQSLAAMAGGVATAGRPETRPALPATEPQIKAIYAIGRGAQSMDESEVEDRCKELFGVTPSALSRRQASEFIDALKGAGKN